MKKTYIKPQLCVVATNADELLAPTQASWAVDRPHDEDKDDYGNIIYDKGDGSNLPDNNDPWNSDNW